MQTIKNFNFNNERAIIRVDFNVPLNDKLEVTDKTRIEAAKQTISYILSNGGSCVLISHLGRPKGRDPKLSLANILETVSMVLASGLSFHLHVLEKKQKKKPKNLKQERFY